MGFLSPKSQKRRKLATEPLTIKVFAYNQLMTPLVTKQFVYELIIRVHWPEDPGEVGLQMAPDVLGDEGLGGLGGVEAVHRLYHPRVF